MAYFEYDYTVQRHLHARISRHLLCQFHHPRLLGDREVGVKRVWDGKESWGVKKYMKL